MIDDRKRTKGWRLDSIKVWLLTRPSSRDDLVKVEPRDAQVRERYKEEIFIPSQRGKIERVPEDGDIEKRDEQSHRSHYKPRYRCVSSLREGLPKCERSRPIDEYQDDIGDDERCEGERSDLLI